MNKGSKTAEEMVDAVVEKKLIVERRASEALRAKCADAITKMVVDLQYETTVELSDEDLFGLTTVTEELRGLNYKFRFIEVQDLSGETVQHKLTISIAHAR